MARTASLPSSASATSAQAAAGVQYTIDPSSLHAHLYSVTLSIARPAKLQVLALPVWIPGSYMVREFAKHLQQLRAEQLGAALPASAMSQVDKTTWHIRCKAGQPLTVRYEIYAFDPSVRTAWLDNTRGFFNPTSLCLRVAGQTDTAHTLHLLAPADMPHAQVATGAQALAVDEAGFGTYTFTDYDQLADTPFVFGRLWRGQFVVEGITHECVVSHAPAGFDGARLLTDTERICTEQLRFWQAAYGKKERPPFSRYVFMLHAAEEGYGGLEHANSTALICSRSDLPRAHDAQQSKGYTTLLGLISHEYFHSWNVKRLRPAELAQYDYSREQYTQLLWFFEGFTSYYDDLFLRRAGLLDNASYLALLARNVQALAINPGAQVQSVAQASFDAWIKYYRTDENTPNATVSYYIKGSLIALCLDLTLLQEGKGRLHDVLHQLWRESDGGPISEADIASVLKSVGGRSYAAELASWVHGTGELPVQKLLCAQGVQWLSSAAGWAQRLGIKVQESTGNYSTLKVLHVLRGSAAETAGLAAADEIIAVNEQRLRNLEQLAHLLTPKQMKGQDAIALLHARDGQLQHSKLRLPPAMHMLRELRVDNSSKVEQWLLG